MRGLNILKQSEPPVNKPNSKLQALKTNLESNIPTEYNNLFNQKEVRKSNLDLTNQDYLSGYENYEDYAGGLDLNEIRAQNQPIFDKAAAGVGRIGTKAFFETAKIPGYVAGTITAPFAEEGQGWETAVNNEWIKTMSKWNEDVNTELLPVYVKKAVSEGNLWDNISSIDFWATEGADGAGFIFSMFGPGLALKALNLGHKVLGTTAKGLSMLNREQGLAGAVRTLEGLGLNAKNIDLAAMTLANTGIEASAEAGSAMESFQKDLDRRLTSGEIDQFQYEQLQTQKAKLGRDIFVSNLAILLVPNAIQTKMIWGKGIGSQLVKDTPSLMSKVANRGKNALGALGSEGFLEEGSQSTVETMFTNKAKRGELTDNMSQDFNVSELVSNYIDTLNTTEGQKAIFLGGVLGGGMSAYQGAKSDMATRKETQDVLTLAEERIGVFNKINETDVYKRDENGDIVYNYNNQPQYDPVKVRDVAKALEYTEEQSQLFDQAIQEGNTQVIQTLKNEAINQLITPFINKGELGIQALSQYLDTTLQTEEIAENEDAKALKSKIIEQATYMQDQLESYKNFSKSLINLNNPDATAQDTTDYYNMLGDLYTNLKGSEYFQKGELKKLNVQKSKLLKDLGDNDITKEINTNFTEGTTEDIYKFKKSETDPRVKLLNDQIETVEKGLSEIDEIINGVIWNNEDVNKQFAKHIEANNKLREQASPENEAIVNQATETIVNATEPEELNNLPKTNTPADKVVQQKANEKKAELKVAKEVKESGIISNAKEDDEAFNGTSKTQTYSTEGSDISDELIPKTSENTTTEEDKEAKTIDPTQGKGVKLISYDRKNGEVLSFIKEQFPEGLAFERNPVNKIGTPVGFEINTNPTGDNSISEIEKRREKDLDNSSSKFNKVVYHGSKSKIEGDFKIGEGLETIHFTEDKSLAENYGKNINKALIDTKNPLIIEGKKTDAEFDEILDKYTTITKEEANGYDSIIINIELDNGKTYSEVIVFDKSQVKFVDKINAKYDAEIKALPQNKSLVSEALAQFKAGNFQNIQLLIDYLPINIKLAEGAYLPIEIRRVNGEMNPETEMLRKSLITSLINGVSIENMNSTITGQYKGVLQVESPTAENSLLDLSGVDGLKYIKENTYFVNIHGQLENILTGQTRAFQNKFTKDLDRTKNYAAGEIYLMVPQADGVSQFPLKLNIKKISPKKATILVNIYEEMLMNDKSLTTTLSEINDVLKDDINSNFQSELNVIGGNKNDIKLQEIIDLLIYQSDNIKSQIRFENGVLYYGNNQVTKDTFDNIKGQEIVDFLINNKRHQIKIRPKTAEDNQRTNLSSNSANYIKYLVEGKILSTNAVVNEPLFQGYTNLFINPIVTIKGSETKKSTTKVKEYTETEIEDRLKGIRTIKELAEGFKTLSKEQQDLYKPLFTEKRIQIEDKGKVKVSDAGAQIASNNFEGLDFGDKQVINQSNKNNVENPILSIIKNLEETLSKTTRTVEMENDFSKLPVEFFQYLNLIFRPSFTGNKNEVIDISMNGPLGNMVAAGILYDKSFSKIISVIKETPSYKGLINKLLENKLQNTRNVENNSVSLPESTTVIEDLSDSNKFVSSSDIPNTVENKQQVEKQNDVFKEPKGLEGQKDTKTITLLKDKVEKGTATEANLKQLEDLKNKYGEEYVKKCK